MLISPGEIEYTRDTILNGLRLDSRGRNEKREVVVVPQTIEKSDAYIRIKRGMTEIEVSVKFEETGSLLFSLGLIAEDEVGSDSAWEPTLKCDLLIPLEIERFLKDLLGQFNLSVSIETRIVRNDGAVVSLLFDALDIIFSRINIPVFKNMHEYTECSFSMQFPECESLAFVGKEFVLDPTLAEETSSDCVLHMLKKENKCLGFFVTGTQGIFEDIADFLSKTTS